MTQFKIRSAIVALAILFVATFCGAQTVTIGPSGNYPNMCAAAPNLTDGETVTVDANGGVPYSENDCLIKANNLTISGINGRPIIDGTGLATQKGLWLINGHDDVIDNFEFRHAAGAGGSSDAMRIQPGPEATPDGANVTIQHCYFHDNTQGLLVDNAGTALTGGDVGEWYSSAPFVKILYDEFAYNGDNSGQSHNIYDGYDTNLSAVKTFTAQYVWSHDSFVGDVMRCRSPKCDIYYNLMTDTGGTSNFILDMANGASAYVVGNVLYKSAVQPGSSPIMITYRQASQATVEPVYPVPYQDVHFINNTIIDAAPRANSPFISVECDTKSDQTQCPAPLDGGTLLTTPGVYENNIMIGYPVAVTNDLAARVENNVTLYNTNPTDANMAALHFANPDVLDFHIGSGSSAIQAGIYPPTDSSGATDPNALAHDEFSFPFNGVTRPTPTGSTMDAGAYHYPPPTAPSLNLSYTHTVTAPGTGTITVTGLPTPPAGTFNYAVIKSTNFNAIAEINSVTSSTSTITTTFTTVPVAATTVVPIYIYVDGTVLTATVTVNPGPDTLASITQDNVYTAATTVHLNGPAPTGGLLVDLSTSDSSIIYAPATVTVPAGTISAETGTLLGSLWGRSITHKTATVTAAVGSDQVQGTFSITSPFINYFECNPHSCATHAIGGQPYEMYLTIGGYAPVGGATVQITSSNEAVVPIQNFTIPAGGHEIGAGGDFYVTTNAVSASTPVTLTAQFNGVLVPQSGTVTVDPQTTGTNVIVTSGSGQISPVGTTYPNPLAVTVTNNGTPVSGATVTFAGTGVTFPGGATAVTNGSGNAQVTAQPTTGGTLEITATVSGGNAPATFGESAYGPAASVGVASGSGQSAYVGFNFASPLVAVVKDAGGNPVPGKTVTFAGTGVSFPSGSTAVSDSNGQASVTAEPTATGSLTVTASVAGVGTPASFSETGTAVVGFGPNGGAINSGGTAVGSFQADELYTGGTGSSTVTNTIDTSGVTNPAPQAVYQVQRYGNFSYIIPELTPNASYTVRLHFSENYDTGAGQREFNVTINNNQVLTNFDIYATAGAEYKAVIEPFTATADSNGKITIQLASVIGNPFLAGVEILPTGNPPASVGVFSGSGQSSNVGTPFTNPLVAIVKDSSGSPVSGVLVTFAGTGVSFPSGNTATTASNGEASVTAEPTATGSLTIDATVSGVGSPAVFSETGTSAVSISSIVSDGGGWATTTVNLTAAAPTGGAVVTFSSSNPSVWYVPASVTVPQGSTSAETGSLLGSLWGKTPTKQSATLTGTYNGTANLLESLNTPYIYTFSCPGHNCSIVGGTSIDMTNSISQPGAAYGGGTETFTSSNTAVIPNQSYFFAQGTTKPTCMCGYVAITTNAVATATNVTVTASFNGSTIPVTLTVNP